MLAKAGRGERALECGAHWPLGEAAARALVRASRGPSVLHNNCSGKHAGFVCLACASGIDPKGYVAPDHPVQREVTAAIADVTQARDSTRRPAPSTAARSRPMPSRFARWPTASRVSRPDTGFLPPGEGGGADSRRGRRASGLGRGEGAFRHRGDVDARRRAPSPRPAPRGFSAPRCPISGLGLRSRPTTAGRARRR